MVVLSVKRNEELFLFETTTSASVSDTCSEVAQIHELMLRIMSLHVEGNELSTYGPAKSEAEEGLDESIVGGTVTGEPQVKGPNYTADPNGRRTGEAPAPQAGEVLRKALDEALAVVSKDAVARKQTLSVALLSEKLDLIRGAVMICFPMGLPAFDPVRIHLEGSDGVAGKGPNAAIDAQTAQLWWAGKQMMRSNKLSDHIGKNEKTKVIVKLQAAGSGAPAREPAVDAETQKAMMAFYHKRQEEMKNLESNDEDDYHNSAWSNSNSLKHHFSGVGNVRFR